MGRKLSHIYTPYRIIFFILLAFLSFYFENANSAEKIISSPLTPVKVVDGDSLEIGTRRIRLMGIDAPEYDQYCKDKTGKKYPCGKDSLAYLKKLTTNKEIRCTVHQKDKYKRDLCTCYADHTNINAEMIRSGRAIVYLESNYNAEQAEAKQHKNGIWSGRFMHPRLFRRLKEEEKKANKFKFTSDSY